MEEKLEGKLTGYKVGTIMLSVAALAELVQIGDLRNKIKELQPPHPEAPFEFVSANASTVILKQDGKEYKISSTYLPQDIKERIAKAYPEFASFMKGGPINIVTKEGKKQ